MIHLYEKIPKTENNIYGVREVRFDNPFLSKPCIVSIIAIPMFLRDVNGAMRQVAELIEPNIDNYLGKCSILGLGFGDYNPQKERFSRFSPTEEETIDFVKQYLLPLVSINDNKIGIRDAMKNMRNVNFLTYCNGTNHFHIIEKIFKQCLEELGYLSQEIKLIMSQICVASISGNVLKKRGTDTLAITFGDINDSDFENPYQKTNIEDQGFIAYDDSLGFAVNGNGDHDFKRHMTGDEVLSPMIKAFLETSIDNAITNSQTNELIPITYEKMDFALKNVNRNSNRKVG